MLTNGLDAMWYNGVCLQFDFVSLGNGSLINISGLPVCGFFLFQLKCFKFCISCLKISASTVSLTLLSPFHAIVLKHLVTVHALQCSSCWCTLWDDTVIVCSTFVVLLFYVIYLWYVLKNSCWWGLFLFVCLFSVLDNSRMPSIKFIDLCAVSKQFSTDGLGNAEMLSCVCFSFPILFFTFHLNYISYPVIV